MGYMADTQWERVGEEGPKQTNMGTSKEVIRPCIRAKKEQSPEAPNRPRGGENNVVKPIFSLKKGGKHARKSFP